MTKPFLESVLLSLVVCALGACAPDTPRTNHPQSLGVSCGDLNERDSHRPFEDRAASVSVHALRASDLPSYDLYDDDLRREEPVGVRYGIAATAGTSREWLERRVHCYRAAHAADASDDALLVSEARVRVGSTAGMYFVDVTSRDRRVAERVIAAAGL